MSGAADSPDVRPLAGPRGPKGRIGGPRPKPVPTGLVLAIALLVISLLGFAWYMLMGGPEVDANRAAGRNSAGPKDAAERLIRKTDADRRPHAD